MLAEFIWFLTGETISEKNRKEGLNTIFFKHVYDFIARIGAQKKDLLTQDLFILIRNIIIPQGAIMSKATELLDELKNLDTDIQSRIDEVKTLEAGLLSSPKWSTDKIKGGKPVKVDDVYAQLIVLKESIEHDTNDVINRKLELSRLINKVSNPKERAILRMTYILKQYPEDIMEHLKISQTTYYRLRKHATDEMDIFLESWE